MSAIPQISAKRTMTSHLILTHRRQNRQRYITGIECGEVKSVIHIDLFILKNMGAAIIDFRVCLPLVKCQNLMFSGFIDTLMYGFSSTGVTIYCYFGLKFNDNTCCEVIFKRRYTLSSKSSGRKCSVIFRYKSIRHVWHTGDDKK